MPVDEHKLQRERQRGSRAEHLLDDEILSEAFTTLEQRYIKAWSATDPSQIDAREHFWKAIQILGDVRKHLRKVANDGKLANKQLEDLALKFQPRFVA
jgi:hypothetical protein